MPQHAKQKSAEDLLTTKLSSTSLTSSSYQEYRNSNNPSEDEDPTASLSFSALTSYHEYRKNLHRINTFTGTKMSTLSSPQQQVSVETYDETVSDDDENELPYSSSRSQSNKPKPPPPPPRNKNPPPPRNTSINGSSNNKNKNNGELLREHRLSIHAKMRAYECKRRTAYESKLQSSSVYWHAFRSLMHDSLLETQKANILIKAWMHAAETYQASMASIGEWCIDERRGVAIVDEKEKKRFFDLAASDGEIVASGKTLVVGGGDGSNTNSAATASVASGKPCHIPAYKRGNLSSLGMTEFYREEKCGSMILSLSDSAGDVSDKYTEMTTYVNQEVLPGIATLLAHLKSEVVFMEKLGDSIMKELETAEEEVCKAWEAYYNKMHDFTTASDKAIKDRLGGAKDGSSGDGDTTTTTIVTAISGCTDVWVEEMHYRMSVAFLSAVWEKCSSELSKLFLSMKDAECNRQHQIKELMIEAVQRQEKLWRGLPDVINPILEELIDWPMEQRFVEDDVQFSIRERAMMIQRDKEDHRQILLDAGDESVDKPSGPGLTDVHEEDANFELSSPLVSHLLSKAKVIEKRSPGMMSAWKVCLAIVTHDSFLQLFELPSHCKLTAGAPPELAFQNLIPPVVVPSMEGVKGGVKFPSAKHWFDNLVPSESFALPNCVVSLVNNPSDNKNWPSFEVVETIPASGVRVFAKTVNRKMQFRTVTREDAKDFVEALKGSNV